MEETNVKRYTIAALVDNEAGVLSQISRLFSRKGYNIETLAVGCTEDPCVSRITIEILTDEPRVQLLCNQLRKLIPVYSVKLLDAANSIRRELVLLKVRVPNHAARNEIIQISNVFRASIIDIASETITLSVIGNESKTAACEEMLREFGILELVRTGIVAIERGTNTINEDTKVKGEFNYGKNVL
ncbi:MAG: acetolactate synthase small subunit [Oscillospiraceae bacterium]|nr:acetolactate synthase small subunit [Oscillospiraceae bacterium]MCC8157359.1 acetolactate synthase small subunit [Oscillospiraceae bacterium]MCD7742846.1 acetolactate synthase small subunit [Oscillospiraceae bacterium]MCD7787191.1 acetolactate synthase small subunit [Oscillospiraceae bacterium]MCD7852956.1 acetolactate synthase small subunit [Oscillospiraceae bacterium]